MKPKTLIILITIASGLAIWAFSKITDSAFLVSDSGKAQESAVEDASQLLDVAIPSFLPSQIKEYEAFNLSFNSDNHTPNYVSWELLPHETDGAQSRHDKFWQDPEINGCPASSDYTRSGYDRGHMCPAADQKSSEKAKTDCFVMANICPQDLRLNAGAWATLEKRERQWAEEKDGLIIVAGPIYEESDCLRIGETNVRVPSAFFKAFLSHRGTDTEAVAFVYPNMPAHGQMRDYMMTIDELEKITGFDFFHALPDDIEDQTESTFNAKAWN